MSEDMRDSVERQARRMKRARERGAPQVLASLGVMGLVGWAVAVPTLIGVAIGSWIDHLVRSRVSWTLTLLLLGALLGCVNAWMWVGREGRDNRQDGSDRPDRHDDDGAPQ